MTINYQSLYYSSVILLILSILVIYIKVKIEDYQEKIKNELINTKAEIEAKQQKINNLNLITRFLHFKIQYPNQIIIDGQRGELVLLQKTFTPEEIETLVKEGYIKTSIV